MLSLVHPSILHHTCIIHPVFHLCPSIIYPPTHPSIHPSAHSIYPLCSVWYFYTFTIPQLHQSPSSPSIHSSVYFTSHTHHSLSPPSIHPVICLSVVLTLVLFIHPFYITYLHHSLSHPSIHPFTITHPAWYLIHSMHLSIYLAQIFTSILFTSHTCISHPVFLASIHPSIVIGLVPPSILHHRHLSSRPPFMQ